MLLLFGIFLLLHFILFIPNYWVNKRHAQILPIDEFKNQPEHAIKLLFRRWNADFFRFNAELIWVIIIGLIFQYFFDSNLVLYAMIPVYLFSFIVLTYHYLILGIFKRYPSWYNDWAQIKQGLEIARHGYLGQLILGILLLIIVLCSLIALCLYFISLTEQYNTLPLLMGCILILIAAYLYHWKTKINPFKLSREFDVHLYGHLEIQHTISFLLANSYIFNILRNDLKKLEKLSGTQQKVPISWKVKPHLAFIAMESYGAILYENEDFRKSWEKFIENKDLEIKNLGYQVQSGFLLPPVSGGNSWLSFFGLLKGIHLPSDAIYNIILKNQEKYDFPSIFDRLNLSDYKTFWFSGIGGFKRMEIDWKAFKQFAGFQKIFQYNDFQYHGPTFNMGPSAPEQFALNRIMELVHENAHHHPTAFFYETINSHYNFDSPTQILSQWKDCQTAKKQDFKPNTQLRTNILDNYLKAIQYQWDSLLDMLKNQKETPYVYIIFGDHQPPIITKPENSFKTPFHIITNMNLDNSYWKNLGLSCHLKLDLQDTPVIKNEEFLNHLDAFMNHQ